MSHLNLQRHLGRRALLIVKISRFIWRIVHIMQASNASYDDNVTIIEEAKDRAENGSLSDMALLARWHLLNEVEGIKRNAIEGYEWSKKAAEGGDCNGMAYRAIWLIHGDREIKKKRDEGVELLVKAANEGSGLCRFVLCVITAN